MRIFLKNFNRFNDLIQVALSGDAPGVFAEVMAWFSDEEEGCNCCTQKQQNCDPEPEEKSPEGVDSRE